MFFWLENGEYGLKTAQKVFSKIEGHVISLVPLQSPCQQQFWFQSYWSKLRDVHPPSVAVVNQIEKKNFFSKCSLANQMAGFLIIHLGEHGQACGHYKLLISLY